MADFNETTAKQIIEKFNLDDKTMRVWKSRGKIPDKYFKEGFVKREPVSSKSDKILSERVLGILFMREINTDTFISLIGAPLKDIKAGKVSFSTDALNRAKKEINRLKIDTASMIEKNNPNRISKIVKDKRIKYYPILRYAMSDSDIKRTVFQLEKHASLDTYLYEKLKDSFVKFLIQLSL